MKYMREASQKDVTNWIKYFQENYPEGIGILGALSLGIPKNAYGNMKPKVFVPENSDQLSLVTVTPASSGEIIPTITLYWIESRITEAEVKLLLSTIPKFNWTKPFLFHCTSVVHLEMMSEILCGDNGLCENKLERLIINHCHTYVYENKMDYDLPEGYFCGSIPIEMANKFYKSWQYNFNDSVAGIEDMIIHFESCVVYYKEPMKLGAVINEDSKTNPKDLNACIPVSWVIMKPNGEIGGTYTFPEFRGKGFASAATIYLCNKMLDKGYLPHSEVDYLGNAEASVKMHTKIGFKKLDKGTMGWDMYLPDGKGINDFETK